MGIEPRPATWQGADAYEAYMGRWSRPMAQAFVRWLGAAAGQRWLDVGCGTGALAAAALEAAEPSEVVGIDPSAGFVATASEQVADPRARFEVGDGLDLPAETGVFDVVVAGLVLNHVSDPAAVAAEMVRVARPGGVVGGYLWDYSGEMQMIRFFWEAVAATDANAASSDPRGTAQYRICGFDALGALFRGAGLGEVMVEAIDLPMRFQDFDDYWVPHILPGPSAAQRYVAALDDDGEAALREQLRRTLPVGAGGSIELIGRAWAVRGTKPAG